MTEGVGDLRFAYIRDVLIAQNREIGGKEVEVTFGHDSYVHILCDQIIETVLENIESDFIHPWFHTVIFQKCPNYVASFA
ncbi:MAG: hypothetical protein O3B83_02750 [Bacteroidetes bacterium]|nr:hypothetical protein [Bacteroidota bacterium]